MVKQYGLPGREEKGGVTNRYLEKSGRKPIPGHRACKREGTLSGKQNNSELG